MTREETIETCSDCGGTQVVWHADDALYVEVMGRKDGDTPCPMCFDRRAASKGIDLRWHPSPLVADHNAKAGTAPEADRALIEALAVKAWALLDADAAVHAKFAELQTSWPLMPQFEQRQVIEPLNADVDAAREALRAFLAKLQSPAANEQSR